MALRITHAIAIAGLGTLGASTSPAQEAKLAFPTPSAGVVVSRNVRYGVSDTAALMMDVYLPPRSATERPPVLIMFNRGAGEDRNEPHSVGWARTAASRGVAAIVPDLRSGSEAQDFQLLLRHLTERASAVGIDPEGIAVYAGSGNVFTAFPLVEDPGQTAIKAAVMFYGSAPITQFRRDLPVLYVRAGLDRPGVNQSITTLAALAVSQNAPLTLINHPTGYHAFEMFNDDDATRDVIERTIDFVKRATAPAYQVGIRYGIAEAEAAAGVLTGQFGRSASIYAELVKSRPDDVRLRLAYGEALLGDTQFAAACAEFEKLKGKGLGARDLGLPAARACMQKGDADAAIAWLRTIPSRFLPTAVRREAVFAPLQDRADFRALFP